jgi:formylglycine-generating enzyme required for sulfatase activity
VDAWLDKEKLIPGQDWELEIRKAVRESDVVVVCLSKQFNQAGFRQKEVRLALDTAMEKPEGEIFIIPVRLEEGDPPESLRKWHWVDLFEDVGYRKLMLALRTRAGKIGAVLQSAGKSHTSAPIAESRQKSSKSIENESALVQARMKESSPKETTISYPETEKIEREKAERKAPKKTNRVRVDRGNARHGAEERARELSEENTKKEKEEREQSPRKRNIVSLIVSLIGLIIALIVLIFGNNIYEQVTGHSIFAVASTPKATTTTMVTPPPTPTATFTLLPPTATNTPTLTPKPTSTISPTKTPTPIVTVDGGIPMVLILGGFFQMHGEQDSIKTYVNSFYIDQHEVTNAQYELCVDAHVCIPPYRDVEPQFNNVLHFGNQAYGNFPVVLVSWNMAYSYCAWRGQGVRLPTISEWEKAARGLLVEQHYPWGDATPVCSEGSVNGANFLDCNSNDAFPVQSFAPNGYGVYDMSGNVAEWVDGYPTNGNPGDRLILGGAWNNSSNGIFVYSKAVGAQLTGYVDNGFRCVKTVP